MALATKNACGGALAAALSRAARARRRVAAEATATIPTCSGLACHDGMTNPRSFPLDAWKSTDKRRTNLRSKSARRRQPSTARGATGRRAGGDGGTRPAHRNVCPGGRRARPATRAGGRDHGLPRRDRPPGGRLPGGGNRAHTARPRTAGEDPGDRAGHARGRRVLPDHRRGLLPDEASPALDRRARGDPRPLHSVRTDHDVDHPHRPGATARASSTRRERIESPRDVTSRPSRARETDRYLWTWRPNVPRLPRPWVASGIVPSPRPLSAPQAPPDPRSSPLVS